MTTKSTSIKFSEAKKHFGKALRKSRENQGLSQGQVATALMLKGAQYISNIERGVSLPSLPILGCLVKQYSLNREGILDAYTRVMKLKFREEMQ